MTIETLQCENNQIIFNTLLLLSEYQIMLHKYYKKLVETFIDIYRYNSFLSVLRRDLIKNLNQMESKNTVDVGE